MDIIQKIKEELKVEKWQVEAAVKLIDEGNTIPFISRYRKEVTGSLNDEQLRNLHERLAYLRNLEEKKEQVLGSIEEQGKLTEELKAKILAAETLVVVEDLYRPYRPKRKTRASIAKEKGLDGLAEFILAQNTQAPVIEEAAKYVTPEGTEADYSWRTVQYTEETDIAQIMKALYPSTLLNWVIGATYSSYDANIYWKEEANQRRNYTYMVFLKGQVPEQVIQDLAQEQ